MNPNIKARIFVLILSACATLILPSCESSGGKQAAWPEVSHENKPWTRWWWQGSAVTKAGITAELESMHAAGIGGVEITPIYGVIGEEDQFIDYLSDKWVDMLIHTLKEAERLDMGVDMATGTGWPFGGPWVAPKHASRDITYVTYSLSGGEKLSEPIAYTQQPMLRNISNAYYQKLHPEVAKKLTIDQLKEPVGDNPNLQALAIDQIKFKKKLDLLSLMAYSEAGEIVDVTDKVDESGMLNWTAPEGQWTLYALFEGWHGKMVERAAPGGEGLVIDHFSKAALMDYLSKFDSAFQGNDIHSLRAFFNDSYEVDDARGEANWTDHFFTEFQNRRGYDLHQFLPALFGNADEDTNTRVLIDYRLTISELLYEHFTKPWHQWAADKGALIRNQSHGSPANILDLYAAIDIPETEGEDILKIKFASSAAHVAGKKLCSSESATWLNEHFQSTLADVKYNLDRYLLGGVNHIFYHGTAYSPDGAEWPGWLFYAAIHADDRNTWWDDFGALNSYVATVQSFMQNSEPDNDVLVYFPIYDRYASRHHGLLEHFDIRGEFNQSEVKHVGDELWEKGYAFDFISDKQIKALEVRQNNIYSGDAAYKTILVPKTTYMPLATFQKLVALAENGASIIFLQALPEDVPGMHQFEQRRDTFNIIKRKISLEKGEAKVNDGVIYLGENVQNVLKKAGVQREVLVDKGLMYNRKKVEGGYYYLVSNRSNKSMEGYIPFNKTSESITLYNPMTKEMGMAEVNDQKEVYLQLKAGESMVLATLEEGITAHKYPYMERNESPEMIDGAWQVEFVKGGPELPKATTIQSLTSWTHFAGEQGVSFSGTAVYTTHFQRPSASAPYWQLDLGEVHESARVVLNGDTLATLIGPTYVLDISNELLKDDNQLQIIVTNLAANRIAYMDQQGIEWKRFYNVNFPAHLAENREDGIFTAKHWEPQPSGLLGPVQLYPTKLKF